MIAFCIVSSLTLIVFCWAFARGLGTYIAFLMHFVCWFRLVATLVGEYGQLYNALWLFMHFTLVIIAIFYHSRAPLSTRINRKIYCTLLIFAGYIGVTVFWFDVLSLPEIALTYALFFTGIPLVIYATEFPFREKDERIIVKSFYAAGLVQVIIGVLQVTISEMWPEFYRMFVIEYKTIDGQVREMIEAEYVDAARFPIGTMGRYNNYAMLLAVYAMFVLRLPRRYRAIVPLIARIRWILLCVVIAMIYMSNSRLALIGFVASIVLYYSLRKLTVRKVVIVALFAVVLVGVLFELKELSSGPYASLSMRAEQSLIETWKQALVFDENFGNGRILWGAGFLFLFLENPLFGYGAGTYSIHPNFSVTFMGPEIPSNAYLFDTGYVGVTTELGIVGMLLLILILRLPFSYLKKLELIIRNARVSSDFAEIKETSVLSSLCVLIMTAANTGLFLREINVFYYIIVAMPFIVVQVWRKSVRQQLVASARSHIAQKLKQES